MAFTDNLQALMSAKGISRRKFAKECRISPSAVNSWFNRSAENISLQTLKKLSDYFGISIEELMHPSMIPETQDVVASRRAYTTYRGKLSGFPLFQRENRGITIPPDPKLGLRTHYNAPLTCGNVKLFSSTCKRQYKAACCCAPCRRQHTSSGRCRRIPSCPAPEQS